MNVRFLSSFQSQLEAVRLSGHRLAVWIQQDQVPNLACLTTFSYPGMSLWLGHGAPDWVDLPVPSQANRLLGSESGLVVCNLHDGIHPNTLAIAAGTIKRGGVMIFLVPSSAPKWAENDLIMPALQAWSAAPEPCPSLFVQRAFALASSASELLFVSADHVRLASLPAPSCPPSPAPGPFATLDQQAMFDAILHVVHGHRRRPLVVTADRGRGKSAALGLAAQHLIGQGVKQILITAPSKAAIASVYAHMDPDQAAQFRFVPPDELLASLPSAGLLLVDEAAAIPVPLLEQMLLHYSRVVFATTIHGYEGSGRGFTTRFREILNRRAPGWLEVSASQAVRWSEGDLLERFISRLLLLDAEPGDKGLAEVDETVWLSRETLAENESLLRAVFGLLVQAHYQTTPLDLRYLLDASNIRTAVTFSGGRVVAVSMVAEEGRLPADLGREIFIGRRRPQGHLLPQTLIAQAGLPPESGALSYWRVMRIAVLPERQRQGFGRAMLSWLHDQAVKSNIDCVGSSFGATECLMDFWQSQGLKPVHLGTHKNVATGEYSMVVLCAASCRGAQLETLACELLATQFPLQLTDSFAALEPRIALRILRSAPDSAQALPAAQIIEIAAGYADGRRSFESSQAALCLLASSLGAVGWAEMPPQEGLDLVARVLQRRSWAECAELWRVAGRRQCELRLRPAAGALTRLFGQHRV